MNKSKEKLEKKNRRKNRTTTKVKAHSDRPRLSVNRTLKHVYAQVIDDNASKTLASASDLSKEISSQKISGKTDIAKAVGQLLAEKCAKANITEVVFDRGSSKYHGRVQALAEGARGAGLKF